MRPNDLRVDHLEQTLEFFPNQWKGMLQDGRIFCCRHTQGEILISISKYPSEHLIDAANGVIKKVRVEQSRLNPESGYLETSELVDVLRANGFRFGIGGFLY